MTSLPSPSPNHILLVEGQDDEHVVLHLCHRLKEGLTPLIKNKKGIKNLLSSIPAEFNVPELRALGILVDANDNLQNRWKAVSNKLLAANIKPQLQLPSSPAPTGTIIEGQDDRHRVGIKLMPDNIASGELENFVIQMIPADDSVWPRSERYIDDIPDAERKFSKTKTPRAKLHAWLAAREHPREMGSAINVRDLNSSGPLCQSFLAWLTKLFA